MTEPDLYTRDCPFCNGESELAKVYIQSGIPLWIVLCKVCGVRTNDMKARDEAINVWNRRAQNDE